MDYTLPNPDTQAEFYAGVPVKRALAWVVDAVLTALITAVIVPFTAFTALFFLPVLYLTVGFLYRTLSIARRSATPGMRLMAIEFRTPQGQRFDLGYAFAHTVGYTLTIGTLLPQVVSMAMMVMTRRGQGLTDIVLGTVAINRPAG